MGDVAAVVQGLRDGGATEIVVCDGHGDQVVVPDMMVQFCFMRIMAA
jgi:D-aminopeptidase